MQIDLDSQESINRMFKGISAKKGRKVSESTRETYLIYIHRFCQFTGMTPDELITERAKDTRNEDIFIRRRHEELLKDFASYLRDEGYSSNTIATAAGSVKSLYASNYHQMVEVNIPSGNPVREAKYPTKEELAQVIDMARIPWHGVFMMLNKDCGMSLEDMLNLKVIDGSPIYGSIATQLKKGQLPIHLSIVREKTGFKYDTFLGEDSFNVLNNNVFFPDMASKRFFPYTPSTIQGAMKVLSNKLGWERFSPGSLRKWFNTQLKLSDMNNDVIEYLMGHSLGKTRDAYFIPPPQKLLEIYEKHYPALKL